MIESIGATLEYDDHGKPVFACQNVNLTIAESEFVGILGPSGSGKSSLLYLLSGLKLPTRGDILYRGLNVAAMSDTDRSQLRLREFGFVFQQPYLLGYLSALENVLVAVGRTKSENHAKELLDALGLGAKLHRRPHELSGGERQRVCVARSLIGEPSVVFADEPTASLDHSNGVQVVELLRQHRGKSALVMVTHDPTMLERSDRVLEIVEGRLAEQ